VAGREHKDAGRESHTLAADKGLKVAGGRTWDPQEWEEDPRFVAAIESLGRGHKREALKDLQALYAAAPEHLYGREQLLALALDLKVVDVIAEHIEWALSFHAQHSPPEKVVETYRSARGALPDFAWSEKALLTIQRVGEKARDNRAVVDAAKTLLVQHPASKAIPRSLLASADAQLREGRPGLARVTLENLLAHYPLDPLVPHAERKLVEVQRQLTEIRRRVEEEERERQQLAERRQMIERQLLLTQQRELRQEQLEQQRLEEQRELERQRALEHQRLLAEYQELERQELLRKPSLPDPAQARPSQQPAQTWLAREPYIIGEDELIVYPQPAREPYIISDEELMVYPMPSQREEPSAVQAPTPDEQQEKS
jgi:hypothetical protein